jgi:hypothetical protein
LGPSLLASACKAAACRIIGRHRGLCRRSPADLHCWWICSHGALASTLPASQWWQSRVRLSGSRRAPSDQPQRSPKAQSRGSRLNHICRAQPVNV